jgi:hypothetical protein
LRAQSGNRWLRLVTLGMAPISRSVFLNPRLTTGRRRITLEATFNPECFFSCALGVFTCRDSVLESPSPGCAPSKPPSPGMRSSPSPTYVCVERTRSFNPFEHLKCKFICTEHTPWSKMNVRPQLCGRSPTSNEVTGRWRPTFPPPVETLDNPHFVAGDHWQQWLPARP